jgi:hypothetical protein
MRGRVVDPYFISRIRFRIQSMMLDTNTDLDPNPDPGPDPDPIRIRGFNDQKFKKKLQLKIFL